jgi:membrane fusion protein, multidrug efflux system
MPTSILHCGPYAIAIVLALTACGKNKAPPAQPPPEVAVITAHPKTAPAVFELTGQTAGFRDVEVRAQVSGVLLKRTYREGTLVEKGTPLFQIDPAPFAAAVEQSKAQLAQQDAAVARAERDVNRLEPLFKQNAVSRKARDDAVANLEEARAMRQAAAAALKQAQLNLDYTRVTAPITGVTSKEEKSEGSLVTAGADSLLTKISQVDPIYVNFSFSDNDYLLVRNRIEAGTLVLPPNEDFDVELTLSDGSKYGRSGKLNFRDTRIDAQTGTIQGRALFPNPKSELVPNQFVRVTLKGATYPNAFLVPQRAVMQGQQGQFVYVVNDKNVVTEKPVQTGEWVGDDWIINGGIQRGDRIIVDGVLKARPGAPVIPVPAQATAPAKPSVAAAP